MIYDGSHLYQHRHIPHLIRAERMYFVTFCTRDRFSLSAGSRDEVLASCVHDHQTLCWIDSFVVMPDHVHLLVAPYETCALEHVVGRIKSASSYRINRLLERSGPLWQRDSFDHIVRHEESLAEKRDYIANNPVRAGLVKDWREYRWFWRSADHVGAG
ncbi:MAG TPA: transposase [Thermoanaerobaculia bacterium]